MTPLLVYVAAVVASTAVVCGHHGERWPIRLSGARKAVSARLSHELPPGGPEVATAPERRTAAHVPTWAQTDTEDAA